MRCSQWRAIAPNGDKLGLWVLAGGNGLCCGPRVLARADGGDAVDAAEIGQNEMAAHWVVRAQGIVSS